MKKKHVIIITMSVILLMFLLVFIGITYSRKKAHDMQGEAGDFSEADIEEDDIYYVDHSRIAPEWTDTYNVADREQGDVRIAQITDVHYYSSSITDKGRLYTRAMLATPGRDALHVEEILDAFIDRMIDERPDAVVVSGDLTLNGEKASHEEFAGKLLRLEENGIPVLVIPGNHDINSPNPKAIYDTGAVDTASVTPEEFEEIYKEFGYKEAIYRDESTLSYVAQISDDVYAVMFDTCIYNPKGVSGGNLGNETKKWIYPIVEKLVGEGKKVFTVTHQNTLVHNERFDNYTVSNTARYVREISDRGVKINLSGHMHTMHVKDIDKQYYDVALSCMSIWPNLYGQLDIRKNNIVSYTTHSISHESDSYNYMVAASGRKLSEDMGEFGLTEKEFETVKEFLAMMNTYYFAGKLPTREEVLTNEGFIIISKKAKESFSYEYVCSMIDDERNDFTFIEEY